MENKRSSDEALMAQLKGARALFIHGSNWNKQANSIVARNSLDTDLGKYSDALPNYDLDQVTRDRLLVRARQDAAEALCHTGSLMDEIHQLKNWLRSLNFTLWVLFAAYMLWLWWKSGFAIFG